MSLYNKNNTFCINTTYAKGDTVTDKFATDTRISIEELNELYEKNYNPANRGVSKMFDNCSNIEIQFMQIEISWITKNVNSKRLFNDIHRNIHGWLNEDETVWLTERKRGSLAWLVDEYLADVSKNGHITQFNVICDRRNNLDCDTANSKYHFDVSYVQKNCENTTRILYTIELKSIIEIPY